MASLWEAHGPRVRAARAHLERRSPFENQFSYRLDRLSAAWRVVRALDNGIEPEAFTDDFMLDTIRGTGQAISGSFDALRETGLLPLLDRQYDLMAEYLHLDDLPAQEIPVLSFHGFDVSESDLTRTVYRVRRTARPGQRREVTPSHALSQAQESLQEAERTYQQNQASERERLARAEPEGKGRRPQPPERKQPRIFKGLGQLVQGAAMTLADIGLAVGAFPFPVSAETQSWGALASITAGVGSVMNGIGDLRCE